MTTSAPARPVRIRFRQSFATVTAVCVMAVGAFSIAGQKWAYAPLMLIPLAGLWWAVRTGVDVDSHGIRVRRIFGSRSFDWDQIEGFSSSGRRLSLGRVSLHLTEAAGGGRLTLPAVTPATLPRLIASVTPEPAPANTDAETLTEA